jgi:hypothetical protein
MLYIIPVGPSYDIIVLNVHVPIADKIDDAKDSCISLTIISREDTFKPTPGNE